MKTTRLVRIAGESILKNKMRTLLTMLGIVIGVGAVIVMVSIGSGAQAQIERQIASLGTNMLVITPGAAQQAGASQGAGTFNRLTVEDAERLEEQGTVLASVSPVIFTFAQVIGGAGNWRTEVQGVAPEFQYIRDWSASAGTFFVQSDLKALRKVAVLGATVASNLFPGEDPVGQRIQIRNVPFTVVGVLSPKGQTANGTDQDDVVLVPYTTMQTRLAGRSFIGQILASTPTQEEIPAAQQEIRAIMRDSHRLGAGDADDFTIRNQNEIADAATGTTEIMTTLLAAIASVSLLVGGIGIMNIMLVSVTERTREIGIRMAIGGRGSDVLLQFLVESVVMSLVGGVIGIAAGLGGASLIGRFAGWSTAVPGMAVVLAVGFSAAVGIVFGFYPARKAAALRPIQALRYE